MYNDKRYADKPSAWDTAQLQGYTSREDGIYHASTLKATDIELTELAAAVSNGATFKPAVLAGTRNTDWQAQQLFALDFDGGTTPQAELCRCRELGIIPCFGYTSFSDTETERHFRLVFCADRVITDVSERNAVQAALVGLFINSDARTTDATRLFYGGKALICNSYDSRFKPDSVVKAYGGNLTPKTPQNAKSSQKPLIIKGETDKKIDAIKCLDVEAMRDLLDLSDKAVIVYSEQEMYDYINAIDLEEYLGIYGRVCCILPEHDDTKPSAHVYTTDDGIQVYKCFGCDHTYTITSITEKLAKCRRSEALNYIRAVYRIELIQSDWTKTQKQLLIDSANYLDSHDFEETYPELANLIKTRKPHIKSMLLYFSQYVTDSMEINGKPYFYASYPTLMDVCGIKGNRNTLSQSLTLFALVNMLEKLPEDKIPDKELVKAKEIAAQYHLKKLTGFYSFEEYGTLLFEESEEVAKTLKANNVTLKGLSREYLLRTFSTDLADKVYPQYKAENKKGNTVKSDMHTLDISECVFYLLEQKGYATERDIKDLLSERYSSGSTDLQIRKSLQEMLSAYGLVRVRASKANKAKYGIEDDTLSYQSYIICNEIREDE